MPDDINNKKKMMGRRLDEHKTLLDLLLFRGIQ